MDTSCSSEGVSTWAIKQEVRRDKCVCSSWRWSAVGQFSSLTVSLLGFHLPVWCTFWSIALEKGEMPKIFFFSIFFLILSWGVFWLARMRENVFSGVPRMRCNVARSNNNADNYRPRRKPKYSSSLYMKKISKTITNPNLNSPSWMLPGQLFLVCNLYFFNILWKPSYGTLFIAPSTDKTSVVHPLKQLDGNALYSHFFSFLFFFLANFQKISFTSRWNQATVDALSSFIRQQ